MLGRTVAELDASITHRELVEWMIYFRMESEGGQGQTSARQQTWEDQFSIMQTFADRQNAKG